MIRSKLQEERESACSRDSVRAREKNEVNQTNTRQSIPWKRLEAFAATEAFSAAAPDAGAKIQTLTFLPLVRSTPAATTETIGSNFQTARSCREEGRLRWEPTGHGVVSDSDIDGMRNHIFALE